MRAPTRTTTGLRSRGRSALRRTGCVPARPSGGPAPSTGGAEHPDRRQFLEVPGLAGADLPPRTLPLARAFLQEALRRRMPARIQRGVPHRLRRFRLLPVPHPRILEQAVRPGSRQLPLRLQSAGTDYLQSVPLAPKVRRAGGPREPLIPGRGRFSGDVRTPALAAPEEDAAADLRVRRFRSAQLPRDERVCRSPGSVPGPITSGIPLRGGDPQPRVSEEGLLLLPARPQRGPRL